MAPNTLNRALTNAFRAPAVRKPDTQRHQREKAKALAAALRFELEPAEGGKLNVWPAKDWRHADPFEGDHCAEDWRQALDMLQQYAALQPVPVAPVVVVREHPKHGPLLFINNERANVGKVVCFDGAHNEADLGYYEETRPASSEAATALLARYNNHGPKDVCPPAIVRSRLNHAMLREQWK